jgi:hypothetical protein
MPLHRYNAEGLGIFQRFTSYSAEAIRATAGSRSF